MSNIPKHLLEAKLINDEQWQEYQLYKQEKEMTLNKIAILKDKIKNKYNIDLVIKDINDVFNYFKENEVWQEYSKMYLLFMETYNTCLIANDRGGNNEK